MKIKPQHADSLVQSTLPLGQTPEPPPVPSTVFADVNVQPPASGPTAHEVLPTNEPESPQETPSSPRLNRLSKALAAAKRRFRENPFSKKHAKRVDRLSRRVVEEMKRLAEQGGLPISARFQNRVAKIIESDSITPGLEFLLAAKAGPPKNHISENEVEYIFDAIDKAFEQGKISKERRRYLKGAVRYRLQLASRKGYLDEKSAKVADGGEKYRYFVVLDPSLYSYATEPTGLTHEETMRIWGQRYSPPKAG